VAVIIKSKTLPHTEEGSSVKIFLTT
jgi:hypothetical protein